MAPEIVRKLVSGVWRTVEEDQSGGGGSQAVLMAPKNISSAQLLALNTTPIQILPAPGGRFYYVFHNIFLHYRFVSAAYNEGGADLRNNFAVGYGTTTAEIAYSGAGSLIGPLANGGGGSSFNTGDLFKQTADAYVNALLAEAPLWKSAWPATAIENKAISVGLTGGSSLTGGDSTLTIRLFYSLIDGAP